MTNPKKRFFKHHGFSTGLRHRGQLWEVLSHDRITRGWYMCLQLRETTRSASTNSSIQNTHVLLRETSFTSLNVISTRLWDRFGANTVFIHFWEDVTPRIAAPINALENKTGYVFAQFIDVNPINRAEITQQNSKTNIWFLPGGAWCGVCRALGRSK